ncbi:MAG: DUF938 domain-containing protein [Sphingomonadaceae bacterium]|nr:DUF938 domain-containing protein [Sphingomonadaceae bacterium]NBU79449.1 DUF938 domain-containing protein [Sphingomonadaceae bacterium]NCA01668.1 DUF938 domain-containing protein [Sphingomonadaceae bacterium]
MTGPQPFSLGAGAEAKRHAPATARNRDAILAILQDALPTSGLVLEIASGTGEHIVDFAGHFPALTWQPSDYDRLGLASIAAWSAEAGHPNLRQPVQLDASADDWPIDQADAILCINMVHISPWAATQGLMAGAGRIVPPGGLLYLYGPYLRDGVDTAPSNLAFDANLKAQNPDWGLRDLGAVADLAANHGLHLEQVIDMPANNLSLIFRRR